MKRRIAVSIATVALCLGGLVVAQAGPSVPTSTETVCTDKLIN
jgi:hypothetical protein